MGTASPSRSARVLLVDSNSTFRAGLGRALESAADLTLVGEAGSMAEAFDLARTLEPNLAVIDTSLADGSGIDLCRRLVDDASTLQALVLSSFDWDVYLAASWAAGAVGFVLKAAPTRVLIDACRDALKGSLYDSQQLRRIQTWERTVGERLFTLTHREWEVLRLVASGHSNREIAQLLSLSEHTVEKHLTALLGKLGVSSRTGLLAFILRYRLDHSEGLGPMAEIRHTGMADFRHREIADFRDVKVPSP